MQFALTFRAGAIKILSGMVYAERVWSFRTRRFIFYQPAFGRGMRFAPHGVDMVIYYKQLNIMGPTAPTPLPMPILQRRCAKDL